MVSVKIILILAMCFFILFIIKKFVFKIFITICMLFVILFKNELDENIEKPIERKTEKKIVLVLNTYRIFDVIERLLLFTVTTLAIYNMISFSALLLFGKQLLATYFATTFTLIITCYASKYYGSIYKVLNYENKSKDDAEENLEDKDEDYKYIHHFFDELSKAFSKRERFKNVFSEDNLKIFAYVLAFCIVFLSKIEYFLGCPLINCEIWIGLSKVALESSVTFIAFDRIMGQCKKIKKEKENKV